MTPQEAYAWHHAQHLARGGAVSPYVQHFAQGGPVQGPNQQTGVIATTPGVDQSGTQQTLAKADYGDVGAISTPGIFSGPVVTMPELGTMQTNYTNLANQALGQKAPQVSYAGSNPWLGQQRGLASSLEQTAAGKGMSAADSQLQQTTQNNVANAYAMQQANPNNAGAARNIAEQAQQTNQAATGQAATLRAQEAATAQGQLGSVLGTGSQQALGIGEQNANLKQTQMANNNSAAQGYLGQLYNYNAAQVDAENKQSAQTTQNTGAVMQGVGTAASIALAAAHGAVVPGKAAVAGDSPKNDTVPAVLSPKEIVLPRSVTQSEDAPAKAAAFVKAIQAKHKKKAA